MNDEPFVSDNRLVERIRASISRGIFIIITSREQFSLSMNDFLQTLSCNN